MPRVTDNSGLCGTQQLEEHEQAFEYERRRLPAMHLGPKSLTHHSYFGYLMDELKLSEGLLILHQKELFPYDFLFVVFFVLLYFPLHLFID